MTNDYYSFGAPMPSRGIEGKYRYGFNGKEKDDGVKGTGNSYNFGERIYDPRLGRWLTTDPHFKADLSPYNFAACNPINFIDPDGKDEIHFYFETTKIYQGGPVPYTQSLYKSPVVIKTAGPDKFFYHNVTKVMGIGVSSPSNTDETTEFFPTFFPLSYSGLTKTPSDVIPFWHNDDCDFVTLAKMINTCPAVGDYLRQHDPNKYFAVLLTAEELHNQDVADKYAAPLFLAITVGEGIYAYVSEARGLWLSGNALDKDPATLKSFNNLIPKRGWYDVVVHGDKYYVGSAFNINGNPISVGEMYSLMLEGGYQQGTPIRLISCNAASGSLAQDLSNLAKAKVIAPSSRTMVTEGGKIITEDCTKYQVFTPENP